MTLIDVIVVLAAVVVVPLALPLLTPKADVRLWVGAGLLIVPSFLLPRGSAGAIVLTLPWAFLASVTAMSAGRRWMVRREWSLDEVAVPTALAYLAGAAVTLVASRAGFTFRHLAEPIVELTAVHYSYAGFVAPVMARQLHRRCGTTASAAALSLLLVAPPIVAAGFVTRWAVLQVGGAVLLLIATWTLAGVTILRAPVHPLLVVSSVAVLAPMVLAVSWAASQFWEVPALSIPDMARTHGTLNAVGFSLLGVVGWRAVRGDP